MIGLALEFRAHAHPKKKRGPRIVAYEYQRPAVWTRDHVPVPLLTVLTSDEPSRRACARSSGVPRESPSRDDDH